MTRNDAFFRELEELLNGDFTGQVVVHCNQGAVVKYDVNETRKPRTELVDLEEYRSSC